MRAHGYVFFSNDDYQREATDCPAGVCVGDPRLSDLCRVVLNVDLCVGLYI